VKHGLNSGDMRDLFSLLFAGSSSTDMEEIDKSIILESCVHLQGKVTT
jgi:hypothetical protein